MPLRKRPQVGAPCGSDDEGSTRRELLEQVAVGSVVVATGKRVRALPITLDRIL